VDRREERDRSLAECVDLRRELKEAHEVDLGNGLTAGGITRAQLWVKEREELIGRIATLEGLSHSLQRKLDHEKEKLTMARNMGDVSDAKVEAMRWAVEMLTGGE
jgi:hypothetical protein